MIQSDQIKILYKILDKLCIDDKVIKRSDIFYEFKKETNSELELYKFEQIISKLIKDKTISGYEIKVGRNGGISKVKNKELITIIHSNYTYKGFLDSKTINKLIKEIEKDIYGK